MKDILGKKKLKQIIERIVDRKLRESGYGGYPNPNTKLSDLSDDSVYFENRRDGTVVELYYNGRNWSEGSVLEGDKPYGWGSKTYQSYLTLGDVINYLKQDYSGKWIVSEEF